MKSFILQLIYSTTKWLKEIMQTSTNKKSSCLYVSEYIVQLNLIIGQPLWHFCYAYLPSNDMAYMCYFDL